MRDKRREVAITCFAMTDHTEKRTQGTHRDFKMFPGEIDDGSVAVARVAEAVVYPPICIAGTEEGEIFIMDWRHYIEIERGACKIEHVHIFRCTE